MKSLQDLNTRGVTLTELMVSLAILGIGILTGIKAFSAIQESIQSSKSRTLATNLGQEKIQILKQQTYNRLMISSVTAYSSDFTDIPYDPYYYAPETILEGGITYTRYTYVQWAYEDSGNLRTDLSATSPDTGMKLVTVTVVWRLGGEPHKIQVRGIDSNPNTVMSNCILNGVVRSTATSAAIVGAQVNIAENIGWRDTANGGGSYTINLSPGSFNAIATADGYFPSMIPVSLAANQTAYQNFYLTPMSSGTIRGTAWLVTHPVISQVVASTTTDRDYEYIELYNPTTSYITMATGGFHLCSQNVSCTFKSIEPVVVTANWAPRSYYLIGNYSNYIRTNNVNRNVDAYFPSVGSHFLTQGQAESIRLHFVPYSGTPTDVLGWNMGATIFGCNSYYETTPVSAAGLSAGEQVVRRTSTGTINSAYGSAYDTDNNSVDFVNNSTISVVPSNSAITKNPIAGTPAYGALVTVSDGLSAITIATVRGNPPYAEFMVPGVATGSWTVFVSSSGMMSEIFGATLNANTTTWVPNSGTNPLWPATNTYAAILSSDVTTGFVSGRVTNASNVPISGISISAPGVTPATSGSNGTYLLSLTPGNYVVTANQNNASGTYVSRDVLDVTVTLGQVNNGIDFMLSQGGRINGFVTRDGNNPLSGVALAAYNADGIVTDQAVTGTNGLFSVVNLATGTYSVQPVLEAGESASPTSVSATVTAGSNISVGTFTITGAFGAVSGNVTVGGTAIKKGVLIVVSTTSMTSSPPALSTMTLTGAGYYAGSSLEDGTYRIEVRGSTTTAYKVNGYYFTFNGVLPVISTRTVNSVMVTPGAVTSGANLAW